MGIDLRLYQSEMNIAVQKAWNIGHNCVLMVLPTGAGKEQPYSEPVLTPDGWVNMGELSIGDYVIGGDGLPTIVTNIFEQGVKDVYKITFKDGSTTRCGLDHLWNVTHPDWTKEKTLPLSEILKKYKTPINKNDRNSGYSKRVTVELCKPVRFSYKDLPLHPYLLGLLIGDGSFRNKYNIKFTDHDGNEAKILAELLPEGDKLSMQGCGKEYVIIGNITREIIKQYGMLEKYSYEKHIPKEYLTASIPQRRALFNGLLDTDGHWNNPRLNEYSTSSYQLMKDMLDLARGLGHSVSVTTRQSKWKYKGENKTGRDNYRIYISFNLTKKTIWNIEKTGTENSRCIRVDNKNHLYLTKDFTVTHNTVCLSDIVDKEPGAVCVIAHRQELVSQISMALARNGIIHRVIAPEKIITMIVTMQMKEFGRQFYSSQSHVAVAGVDTLIRRKKELLNWCKTVKLWVIDECHHLLSKNKWGIAVEMFPNARGLGVTATPLRADGKGLGADNDGEFHNMIVGPSMRDLINDGYLTDYRIFAPMANNLDLSKVRISKTTGDYIDNDLSAAISKSSLVMHDKSTLTGDVVGHYLKIAKGKLGITFVPSMEIGEEITKQFNDAGVPAMLVNAKTPDDERADISRRFANRELLQLVNMDIFGEGYDLPALECVSFARKTESYGMYCLDNETEILTDNGWKGVNELNNINNVQAFNLSDNSISIVPVSNKIKRKLYNDEKMYGIEGIHLNIKVSDNHNMIVKSRTVTSKNWMIQKAVDVSKRKSMFVIPVAGYGDHIGADLTNDELRFLGWFLSDGSLNKLTNAVQISQAINKSTHLKSIRDCLKGCGFRVGEYLNKRKNCPPKHNDIFIFSISKGNPRKLMDRHLRGWNLLDKWINKSIPECYNDLTREQLLILLETLNLGDGNNNHDSLDYVKHTLTITCGDNELMADRIQELCITRGLRCNKSTNQYGVLKAQYILNIRDVTTSSLPGVNDKDGFISNKKPYKRTRFTKQKYLNNDVWCVENKLNTLITRRKGKVAIVGNCQMFGRVLRLMIDMNLHPNWNNYTTEQRLYAIATSTKRFGIIIDHVGNVVRHGLPDAPRSWSLNRRSKRAKAEDDDVIPVKSCPECTFVYERYLKACPECGHIPIPISRTGPEFVDGDLSELTPELLAEMRGEVDFTDSPIADQVMTYRQELLDNYAKPIHIRAHCNRLTAKLEHQQHSQSLLRNKMAWWAGYRRSEGISDDEIFKMFYLKYKVDWLSAQALPGDEADELIKRLPEEVTQ